MVHIHAESKNFNASGDDANDIQVKLDFSGSSSSS